MDTITASSVDDRFVTVDGLSIRYVEAGAGLPLILLHGASLGSSADVFLRNLGPLAAAGFRPIAFDQPGFGLSDNPTDFSVGYRKKSIMGFIDALGLEKVVLVGHSQAGNMAVANAFENPDRISHVVILGTGSLLPPLPGGAPKKKAPPRKKKVVKKKPTPKKAPQKSLTGQKPPFNMGAAKKALSSAAKRAKGCKNISINIIFFLW